MMFPLLESWVDFLADELAEFFGTLKIYDTSPCDMDDIDANEQTNVEKPKPVVTNKKRNIKWINPLVDQSSKESKQKDEGGTSQQEEDFKWSANEEEPLVGTQMEFDEQTISSTYSEYSEASDDRSYPSDEEDVEAIQSHEEIMAEVKKLQTSANFVIPKSVVDKYVMDILKKISPELDIEEEALDAIQTVLENNLVKFLEVSRVVSKHFNHPDILPEDIKYAIKYCNIL